MRLIEDNGRPTPKRRNINFVFGVFWASSGVLVNISSIAI